MTAITLDTLVLEGDLNWTDEFEWSPVERGSIYSLTGSLILSESTKQAGRPITLEAQSEFRGPIWLSRDTIEDLYTKVGIAGLEMTLTLSDLREFTVAFREDGLIAVPVYHVMPHVGADPYYLTLKLQTV